jgi:hypothetical protein
LVWVFEFKEGRNEGKKEGIEVWNRNFLNCYLLRIHQNCHVFIISVKKTKNLLMKRIENLKKFTFAKWRQEAVEY